MKSVTSFSLLLAISVITGITGCTSTQLSSVNSQNSNFNQKPTPSSPQLTNDSAQRAIEILMNLKGGRAMITATVLGIQEAGNAARADVTFTGSLYSMDRGTTYQVTNAPGVALFTHYTDGRWVLTKVAYGPQLGFQVNGNIPITDRHD